VDRPQLTNKVTWEPWACGPTPSGIEGTQLSNSTVETQRFDREIAPRLAKQIGVPKRWDGKGSDRFSYFEDDTNFVVIAGPEQGAETELALARGLTNCGSRRLVLVLPTQWSFSTMQRVPWFVDDVRPQVYLHDGNLAHEVQPRPKRDTIAALTRRLKPRQDLAHELRKAATPVHFGPRSRDVFELVEWATKDQRLDPGHRRSERSWHCMGQKVLSIKGAAGGLMVRGGIHFGANKDGSHFVEAGRPLTGRTMDNVLDDVERGIKDRLDGNFTLPDEHWLQAVIGQRPSLVGVEQPALRELPAWRPKSELEWHRGYIDLMGVDAHGDLRLIETKLAKNKDDLLILQGLDYYIWARAYESELRTRLGTPEASQLQLHYVIGDVPATGKISVSPFAAAQAHGLDPEVPWRFQTVRGWFNPEGNAPQIRADLLEPRVMPSSE